MRALLALVLSARQLLWLVAFTVATGLALLLPVFVAGAADEGAFVPALRSAHSAASFLLVVGALGHAAARVRVAGVRLKGVATGVAASTAAGLAAVSGAALVAQPWWAQAVSADPDALRHAAGVFHYGYSAALLVGLGLWHAGPAQGRLLPRFDTGSAVQAVAVVLAGAILAGRSEHRSPVTFLLVPTVAAWSLWSVLLPQLAWLAALRRKRSDRDRFRVP